MNPFDPSNPIGGDNFSIVRPMPAAPKGPGRPKRLVPEVDDLFAAQKALVKTVNYLRGDPDQHDVDRALERAEAGYKLIREWLAKHGNEGRA